MPWAATPTAEASARVHRRLSDILLVRQERQYDQGVAWEGSSAKPSGVAVCRVCPPALAAMILLAGIILKTRFFG